ncbi:effector-associated constant component EACC1 [Yinghuangia seranimata]|uniref:effector-associated constant component EACC1 n=1 Tax=Yinghuangia seranimata TaxID=408067 RepID=UPI00248B079B|nr:hypothetical protein [Yinghuangia seranimata]MDI2130125.1 hypothetical protein [Yinghuangia seranimata]
MEIRLSWQGDDATEDGEATLELYEWLMDDLDVRRATGPSLTGKVPGPGEMGSVYEVVELVVNQAVDLGNLLLSLAVWRSQRSRRGTGGIRVEHDGVSIVVEDGSPETVARVVRALRIPDAASAPAPPSDAADTGEQSRG